MKPAPFDYQAPSTLREAIDLLASNPEAFVVAGGQSLLPVLAFRLATPSLWSIAGDDDPVIAGEQPGEAARGNAVQQLPQPPSCFRVSCVYFNLFVPASPLR